MAKKRLPYIESHNGRFILVSKKNSLGRPIGKKMVKKLLKTGKYQLREVTFGFGRDNYSLKESKEAAKYI